MHRNVYINSPSVLRDTGQMRSYPHILIAGQLSGVEGYLESAASGILTGINAWRLVNGQEPLSFPRETMLGALMSYISDQSKETLQPMHAAFGLLPPVAVRGAGGRGARLKRRELLLRLEASCETKDCCSRPATNGELVLGVGCL